MLVLCIQRKDPHDRGRDAVHSCMTALDQARADDELFPTYLLNPERLVIRAPRILDCDPAWTLRLMPVCHECIHMDSCHLRVTLELGSNQYTARASAHTRTA